MELFIDYMVRFNWCSAIVRIILAAVIGGIVGSERGRHGSAAGLRTHILVCVGAAMTALTSMYLNSEGITGDVGRLPAQVISGIGFLGAGMIIVKNGSSVTGLTTAAGMWATAALGISLGYGFYVGTFIGVFVCVFAAAFLTRVERKRKMSHLIYAEIEDPQNAGSITDNIRGYINGDMLLEIVPAKSGIPGNLGLLITVTNLENFRKLRAHIEKLDGIFFAVAE